MISYGFCDRRVRRPVCKDVVRSVPGSPALTLGAGALRGAVGGQEESFPGVRLRAGRARSVARLLLLTWGRSPLWLRAAPVGKGWCRPPGSSPSAFGSCQAPFLSRRRGGGDGPRSLRRRRPLELELLRRRDGVVPSCVCSLLPHGRPSRSQSQKNPQFVGPPPPRPCSRLSLSHQSCHLPPGVLEPSASLCPHPAAASPVAATCSSAAV